MALTTVPVTADNFARAETDWYFDMFVKRGALGGFIYFRELPPIDLPSVRPNRDTLYSHAVFDLGAGAVQITLPDAGERFLSLIAIDEDHYVYTVVHGAGTYTFSHDQIGTRYLFTSVRTLVDPSDPQDLEHVHALQDAISASQPTSGSFEIPEWDQESQKKVRDALQSLGSTFPDLRGGGGSRDEVDPVRHLIATASAWGLNPDKDAIYLNVAPHSNDGSGTYKLTVKDVPVDGFWSISVYDEQGHFVKNDRDAYTLNNITATRDTDGSVTVQFGGCDGQATNCLPIFPGWNYLVRLYRPRAEALSGEWTFPEAKRVE